MDEKLLQRLASQIRTLGGEMIELESALLSGLGDLHPVHGPSARNLAHYMALRRHDMRELQSELTRLGLSSLGRTEGHVLNSLDTVYRLLNALVGAPDAASLTTAPAIEIGDGAKLLEDNTEALLGTCPPGRKVRIMVTMSTEASRDYELVRDLLQSGMDCMRINCSHDSPEVWLGMIRNLEKAREEVGRPCRVAMDLAGPKLRTGRIEPGPAVVKCRPKRDIFGRVVTPARVRLKAGELGEADRARPCGEVTLPVPGRFVSGLRVGDLVRFRDARGAQRSLRVIEASGEGCLCQMSRTAYLVPGLQLSVLAGKPVKGEVKRWKAGKIGALPRLEQVLTLKEGDTLVLLRSGEPGKPMIRDSRGGILAPAQIGVSLPEFLEHAQPGEPIWFDDGKIGAVIRSVDPATVRVEITQARAEGEKLAAEKGINLPETRIESAALTAAIWRH